MIARDYTARQVDQGRRRVMLLSAASAAALPGGVAGLAARANGPIKAVVFDGFPIFDPRAVFAAAEAAFPGRGEPFWQSWFQKIFASTWLRTSARQYISFGDVAAECLDYAFRSTTPAPDRHARERVLAAFSNLEAWPDVKDALNQLRAHGFRLAMLSNLSEAMLRANLQRNGLTHFFEAVLSTDMVRAYKPAPEAYALATRTFGLRRQQIGFAAFAAWDAAGASWFGYPTAWVNRAAQQPEPGAPSVPTGRDLTIVARLVQGFG